MKHNPNAYDLVMRERQAIERAKATRLAAWQVQSAYYLAMLNNKGKKSGRKTIKLELEVGSDPKLRELGE